MNPPETETQTVKQAAADIEVLIRDASAETREILRSEWVKKASHYGYLADAADSPEERGRLGKFRDMYIAAAEACGQGRANGQERQE
jgi:hypothetical protein